MQIYHMHVNLYYVEITIYGQTVRGALTADMQKFPLRMKDNDLLVTELYRDPTGDSVTALSVYLTPKTSE